MFTQAELSKRMRDQFYLLDPEVSLEVGTPERKIIDIVAQALTDIQFEKFIQQYPFDIETKFGQDLDDFCQLFGFARQTARRATGFVTFQRQTPAPNAIFIPAGTQVSTTPSSVEPMIMFITVTDAVIPANGTFVEVPIEATIPGVIGNVSANKVNRVVSQSRDFSFVNNSNSISGGYEQESDDAFKVRFKNNIFRNISGTNDQFLALAIANQFTNRARVIGPVSRFEEYLTIDANGTATSFNPNPKHVYDFNYYLSTGGNETSTFYDPVVDYSFTVNTAPVVPTPVISVNNVTNPAPLTAPVVGTAAGTGVLQSTYDYAYSYVYRPGGEGPISPVGNTVTLLEQDATIGHMWNSGTTSLAGGTVYEKRIYRKDYNYANPQWEMVGTVPVNRQYSITGIQKVVSGGTATGIAQIDTSSVNIIGLEVGGSVTISGIPGSVGTNLNGTYPISAIGTSSISYTTTGTAIGSVTATGTAVADVTSFTNDTLYSAGNPPSNALNADTIVFLEHEYLSKWSRNVIDVNYSSLNKVDIYISGQNTTNATDVTIGPGNIFVNDVSDKYHYKNFVRDIDHSYPDYLSGNYFINLSWCPVRTVPSQLTIDGQTYYLNDSNNDGNAYWLVKDITDLRDSYRSRDGIEVSAAMASAIEDSIFSIDYTFDKLPYLTNNLIETHKQVGQDVLVHTANFRSFRVNLVIIYSNGFNASAVNPSITNALELFFNEQKFGAIIQLSDILQIVYGVGGVDSARIATASDDATHYGVEEVAKDGSLLQRYTQDFIMEEIELPVLHSLGPDDLGTGTPVAPLQRTQNNWTI